MSIFIDTASYRIEKLQTHYRLTNNTTHQHIIDFDLELLIYEYIEFHVGRILRVIRLFDDQDAEKILNDELGNKVVHMAPKVYYAPGYYFDNQELREWHHCSLIDGYNNLFGTRSATII